MFSIFKNDVSKRFPLRRGIRGRMFPSDYGIFFSIFSFFPLPPTHLVIPSECRELGATRDPALQRTSFSLLLSTLAPYCLLPALQRSLAQYSCSILSCSILNHEGYPLNFNI